MINLEINGKAIQAMPGTTILQAAQAAGIDIPFFCRDDRINTRNCMEYGDCKMCSCKVEGVDGLVTACNNEVEEGMKVWTESEQITKARREILWRMLSKHPLDCVNCKKLGNCKLQTYCVRYDVKDPEYRVAYEHRPIDDSMDTFYTEFDKCILCGKCVRVCRELVGVEAIKMVQRGFDNKVIPTSKTVLSESSCVECGNCSSICPVGAIVPKYFKPYRAWEATGVDTVCLGCGLNCSMDVRVKDGQVMDVLPEEGSDSCNLLCKKGKFTFWRPENRVLKPMALSEASSYEEVTYEAATEKIKAEYDKVKEKIGPKDIVGVVGYGITVEEKEKFQEFMNAIFRTYNIVTLDNNESAFTPLPCEEDKNIDVIESRCMNCMVRCKAEENVTVPFRKVQKAIRVNYEKPELTHILSDSEALKKGKVIVSIGEVDKTDFPKKAFTVMITSHLPLQEQAADVVFPGCLETEKEGTVLSINKETKTVRRCVPNPEDVSDLAELLDSLKKSILE